MTSYSWSMWVHLVERALNKIHKKSEIAIETKFDQNLTVNFSINCVKLISFNRVVQLKQNLLSFSCENLKKKIILKFKQNIGVALKTSFFSRFQFGTEKNEVFNDWSTFKWELRFKCSSTQPRTCWDEKSVSFFRMLKVLPT